MSIFGTTLPASAQAEVIKSRQTIVDDTVFPGADCNGIDYDIVRREFEIQEIEMTDGKGRQHRKAKQKAAFTFLDVDTGETYMASNNGVININPNTATAVIRTRLILPGPGNNVFITTKIHRTTNANGEMVVNNLTFETECR